MFGKKRSPTPERQVRNPQLGVRPKTNAVFSYHANRSVRETSQIRDAGADVRQEDMLARHASRASWRSTAQILITAALLLAIVFLGFQLSDKVSIVNVNTGGSQVSLRPSSVYAAAAQKEFASGLNRNKLTVDTSKISTDLQQQFPELKAVSISLPLFGNRPVVYIQPTVPQIILTTAAGTSYALDSNGRALIDGSSALALAKQGVPVVGDQSGLNLQVGQIALQPDAVAFITQVVGQLKAKGFSVNALTLPASSDELFVGIQGLGYQTKYNLHGDAREEAGAFLATKQYLDGQHKTPGQYIDVRVEGKAYYK